MKNLLTILFLLLAASAGISADTLKEIKAVISTATVYPDRARLNHLATFDLDPGKTILKLTGLSPYIDAQSIQVKGIGEYTVLSVNLQNNYLQNLEDLPEIKSMLSQIDALRIKVEDEKAAINTLDEKHAFLEANRAVLVKETTFSIDQFRTLMDLYTTSIDQVTVSKLKKSRLIIDYERQIAALQKQIADRKGKQQLPSGEISVTVSSEKPVAAKMSFTYVVTNAGWYPSYDIRVEDINKPVDIFYKANVFQNTGVEWKNVKLSFSNATPWVTGDVPVLNPWFIDFYKPVKVYLKGKTIGTARSEAPAMLEEADASKKMEVKDVAASPVVVEKTIGEMSVTFDVAIPYTIPADGKIQTIEIQRTTTPAEYKYVTVPKLSTLAYLTANITDWAKQSLLSGEATLYFENTYVGKSSLNVNQFTDTLAISLGTDNSILVKREKRKDFTTRKIIGVNKSETNSFLITIRNNKTNPVKVSVNDQLPVSSNSGITVDPLELSGGTLNSDTGVVKWDLEIKPQEKKELILTYSVKYPKNQNVILE